MDLQYDEWKCTMNGNNSAAIALIKIILTEFQQQELGYCLLRNYEFLLDNSLPVESLDTVISRKDLPKVRGLFKRQGFLERKQQFSLAHKSFFKLTSDLQLVSFDIQVGGVYWNDLMYLGEKALENRVRNSWFYTLHQTEFIAMLIIHSILGKRRFKLKYQQQITENIASAENTALVDNIASAENIALVDNIASVDQQYLFRRLALTFGKKKAVTILNMVKKGQFHKINCNRLVASFLMRKPRRIVVLCLLAWRWLKQRKNPLKLFPLISIIGPDGAGKSSLSRTLKEFLVSHNRKAAIIYVGRGRENILPFRRWRREYKQQEKKNERMMLPEQAPSTKKKITYAFASVFFFIDLWLRYWLRIFPGRKKSIVITDRYCSDIMLIKYVPLAIRRLMLKCFPKPTLTIFLYNDLETLHLRRPKEPVAELQRQLKIFNRFRSDLSINTSDPEKDNNLALRFIYGYLLQHWR